MVLETDSISPTDQHLDGQDMATHSNLAVDRGRQWPTVKACRKRFRSFNASLSTKRNIVANFAANAWQAAISLAFVPIYVHFIGIESYGLIGIYGTFQAISSVLDMGMTTTMNREMARSSTGGQSSVETRDLVRSLEIVYWSIALAIGAVVFSLSGFLAQRWITGVDIPPSEIRRTVVLIAFVMIFQWPFTLYAGGLMGLQKQVLLGGINVLLATLRAIGAVLILWLLSPTVQAFFTWQIGISLASTALVAWLLWRSIPKSGVRPSFRMGQLRRVWRFSAGVALVSVLGVALTQSDKVILSRILPLDEFGYYALAGVVSVSLLMLVNPVYQAVFPRLSQLVSDGNQSELTRFYHWSAQILSVLLIPAVVVLALFSREVMFVWTGDPLTALITQWTVTLLVIGTGLYGLSHIPWALQLAYGWTRLGLYKNMIAVVLTVPFVILLANRYGAVGAAAMWVILNSGALFLTQPIMHRRLLQGELKAWCLGDIGAPVLASVMVGVAARLLVSDVYWHRSALLFILAAVWLISTVAAALAARSTRNWLVSRIGALPPFDKLSDTMRMP